MERPAAAVTAWEKTDWICLFGLSALCIVWSLHSFHWSMTPVEDAAMLLRYSDNLARGYGLRWNPGSAPVDGATDFLYAVTIGVLARVAHINVITASRVLNLLAQLFSCGLVYVAARRIFGASRWFCVFAVSYLIAGPGWKIAEACFSAPFFAAALLLTWCCGLHFALRRQSTPMAILFGLSALASGLIRPEGVLMGGLIAVAIAYLSPSESRAKFLAIYVGAMVLLGTPYFLWHWHYFGHPLPNPFYVKGNGHLYPSSVRNAAVHTALYLAPFVPLIPLGYISKQTVRLSNAYIGLLLSNICMWVLLADWNNHFFRFQYPLLPLTLVACAGMLQGVRTQPLFEGVRASLAAHRRTLTIAFVLAVVASMSYIDRVFPEYDNSAFGMQMFASRLQPFAADGYTMAVTEAGALPLYSTWKTIDLLGLNDAVIAHGGAKVIPDYLAKARPELIMIHVVGATPAQMSAVAGSADGDTPPGYDHFVAAAQFARREHYILAALYGANPCNLHGFWVRPDAARATELVELIRNQPYYFLDSGLLSHDFRNEFPPQANCRP